MAESEARDQQIALVRRMLHFGVVVESLPVAAETIFDLDSAAALDLVAEALREGDVEVVASEA